MRTSQSKLVREALESEHCREVYGRRAPRSESAQAVAPNFTGQRVNKGGRVEFVTRGFALVRWDDGTSSSEWFADLDRCS
jgi:hypothetical protein